MGRFSSASRGIVHSLALVEVVQVALIISLRFDSRELFSSDRG